MTGVSGAILSPNNNLVQVAEVIEGHVIVGNYFAENFSISN